MRKVLVIAAVAAVGAAALSAAKPVPAQARQDAAPFLWGVATSGFQSEGDAPDSNWRRYAEGHEPYGQAVDFRHRYAEDIANAASLGAKVFRFGIEWARVEPRPGQIDEEALAYYDDVVREIRAAGMRPMITLDHWVYPGWIADQGGWSNAATVQAWLTNARRIVERYAGNDALWITFNEPAIYLQHELSEGGIQFWEIGAMSDRIVRAHNEIYDVIHETDPGAQVSSNAAYIPSMRPALDAMFHDRMRHKLDFAGLDFYYGASLDNLTAVHAASGEFWKVKPQPDGLYYALRYYARKYPELPLYVVENGMPTDNGQQRPDGYTRSDHLRDHVYWVQRAKAEGINVIGYNYWSITDNYEWGSYRPRFGLYTVDAATDPDLIRTPTDAVAAYRELTAAGGVPGDYRPVARPGRCSLVDGLSSCLNPAREGPIAPLN